VVDSNNVTFQQTPGVNFTMPVGSNPLAQAVNVVSTGANFNFIATAQTAGGGNWLQSACSNSSVYGGYNTPSACSINVKAATLSSAIYAGQVTFTPIGSGPAMTVPVTLTVGNPGSASTITQILNATGEAAAISQNTWVEIKGANLAQVTQDWSSQTSFAQGLLPTSVAGVSATVNNKPAFIYYVSPAQINILTPLDTGTGAVTVKLTTPLSSAPITAGATMVPNSLGIFTANFTGNLYPSAYHAVSTCSTKYNGVRLLAPPHLVPRVEHTRRAGRDDRALRQWLWPGESTVGERSCVSAGDGAAHSSVDHHRRASCEGGLCGHRVRWPVSIRRGGARGRARWRQPPGGHVQRCQDASQCLCYCEEVDWSSVGLHFGTGRCLGWPLV